MAFMYNLKLTIDSNIYFIWRYTMQGAHASALCELGALIETLQATHELISNHIDLPDWSSIFSTADDAISLSLITGRIVTHTTKVRPQTTPC